MSEKERAERVENGETAAATPASARSTHIAHIGPATWHDLAARVAPMVARVDRTSAAVQVVVFVPTGADATALGRELSALETARDVRIAPFSAAKRARRLAMTKPQVVVGPASVIAGVFAASALPLGEVGSVALLAADELDTAAPALEQLLAEMPNASAKLLSAAASSPFVERLLAAHLHGARRTAPVDVVADGPAITVEVRAVSPDAPAADLGEVLETVDAPSAAVVAADARRAAAAQDVLSALGYALESPLARLAADGTTGGAALVVFVGVPARRIVTAALATGPARVVALLSSRERAAFALAAPGARLVPFASADARAAALAGEDAMRERLRRVLAEGVPTREMLAIESLLDEHDPLAVAGAALRLYEREVAASRRIADARVAAGPPATASPPRSAAPRGASGPRDAGPRSRDRNDRGTPPARGGDRFSRDRNDRGDRPGGRGGDRPPSRGPRPPAGSRPSAGPRPSHGRDDR